MPLGDLADIAAIGAEQAVNGDRAALDDLARRYGANDTLVAYAINQPGSGGGPRVEVYFTRYGDTQRQQTLLLTFAARGDEDMNALLARAAERVAREVEDRWKSDNLIRFGSPGAITARVPVRGLSDWVAVERRIRNVAVISETSVILLSRSEVQVELHFLGDVQQLQVALEQVDLELSDDGTGWVLRPVGARDAGRARARDTGAGDAN
jgi:hypothetical protein